MTNRRFLTTLQALAILLSCVGWTPAQAEGTAPNEESIATDTFLKKQYISSPGTCSPIDGGIYCEFAIDVNEMQHYIRTVPDAANYATGPYYSNIKLFIP